MFVSNQNLAVAQSAVPGLALRSGAAVLLALVLAGCGKGSAQSDASQVLARVNGDEITIHQLNQELNALGGERTTDRKQLLDSLIDRQLLVQAAQKAKLDQTPSVVQEIERARTQVLARAYLSSKVRPAGPPSRAEEEAFYNANPDYFTNRKAYTFSALTMPAADFPVNQRKGLEGIASLEQAAKWLDDHNLRYQRTTISRTTDALIGGLRDALKGAQPGKMFVITEADSVVIAQLREVHDSPVSLENAQAQIARYLANQAGVKSVQDQVAQLRSSAKVDLQNQQLLGTAPPAAAAVQPEPAAAGSAASKPAPAFDRAAAGLR